jgi:hypothetical protein
MKVIMQAGGNGYGKLDQAIKRNHKKVIKLSFLVERIIELEWVDAVSSADTGLLVQELN